VTGPATKAVPLFPLHTVLYPGGQLPLRIFEPRYLRMIRRCVDGGSRFGVVLIKEGQESGQAADIHPVGTFAKVAEYSQQTDNLLQVTAVGEERFQVQSLRVQRDQLLVAETLAIKREPDRTIPAGFKLLRSYLDHAMAELGVQDAIPERYLNSARWVSYRLAELLPLSLAKRQWLLELTDPVTRLEALQDQIQQPRQQQSQGIPASIRELFDS